ncbi:MAG TPA: carbohydrate porin [Candidatus Acidoferrum sp.]|nr:carbohydrate porin [Candidatus Acidoferrum sp.]
MQYAIDSPFRKFSSPNTRIEKLTASENSPRRRLDLRGAGRRVLLTLLLAAFVFALAFVRTGSAQEQSVSLFGLPERQHLLGDWGGERTALAEKGLTFDFFYITDLEANPSGGLEQAQAGWMRIRGTMDLSFDHLIAWQGLSIHATALWQSGANLGAKIGTLANPSDLVSAHTTRLDSFWVQQLFFDKKLRIRAGQLAGLDFYGNQDYGGSWLIEPMGYAFGNLFPSIFESFDPAGTPGVEVRFAPRRSIYVKSSVMSGNRDPYHQDPTGTNFEIKNSATFLFEAGYLLHPPDDGTPSGAATTKVYPGSYKFGGIYNGGKFPDAAGVMSSGNYLIYGMASQAVFRTDAGSNRGLDLTAGFDYSPDDVARENVQVTVGGRFNAPFASRPKDRVGVALVYSKISDSFSNFGVLLGGPPLGSEKAVELNYSLQVTPYWYIQPVFQYYVDVGANGALPNAPVLGFRTKVNF